MKRNTTEAQDVRHALLAMIERLRHYKEQRERLLDTPVEAIGRYGRWSASTSVAANQAAR